MTSGSSQSQSNKAALAPYAIERERLYEAAGNSFGCSRGLPSGWAAWWVCGARCDGERRRWYGDGMGWDGTGRNGTKRDGMGWVE